MSNKVKRALSIALTLSYLIIGILTIVYAFCTLEKGKDFLGGIVILSSVVHILLYFINDGFKNKENGFYLILGIIGLSLGIVFIVNQQLSIFEVCMYWGILDIIRGSCEITHIIPKLKANKLEYIELAVSIGDIILGILLCIKTDGGIIAHLTYLGSAFILTAFKYVIDFYISRKSDK